MPECKMDKESAIPAVKNGQRILQTARFIINIRMEANPGTLMFTWK